MAWCAYAKPSRLKRHVGHWQSLFANTDGAAVALCESHALGCTDCGKKVGILTEVDKPAGAGPMHPVVVLCGPCLLGRVY